MTATTHEAAPRSPQARPKPGAASGGFMTPTRLGLVCLAAAALVLLFFGGGWFSGKEAHSIPTAQVKRGGVKITITEAGELRAENQATINASTDKTILWLAPEGKWVEEGDPLIKFQSEKYEIARDSAESGLAVAEADLARTEAELVSHGIASQQAHLDYQGMPELAKKGFITQNEVETARLTYEEVKSQKTSFEAAVRAAKAAVAYASREIDQQERKLREGTVLAPRAGLVVYATFGTGATARKIQTGMTPFEGMELMFLPDTSTMVVDTEIGEVDLSRVKEGTPAALRIDAYPDSTFEGEVTSISLLARQKISKITGKPTGIKVFDVTIQVKGSDDRLKPGLSATVDLLISDHPDVLYVPIAAVFLNELDQTIAYIDGPNGVEERRIELADSSERVAVVTSGLAEGDDLLLARPARR